MGTSCKIIVVLHEPVMPASFQGECLFKNMALCLNVFGVEVQASFLHSKMLFILILCSTLSVLLGVDVMALSCFTAMVHHET